MGEFPTTGDPNGKELPNRPVFDGRKTTNVMVLSDKPEAGSGPLSAAQVASY